jgi:chemotaxis protein methyltransferase CheR
VREFDFSQHDFERVRRLIRAGAGIHLGAAKQDMVYSRLSRRLRALKLQRFRDYLDLVESPGSAEWNAFTNALTTNLTAFFREPHHFDFFTAYLQRLGTDTPVRVWCCAASSGEEPYSIAIAAMEAFSTYSPPVSILATDIDTSVLERAREGIYPLERLGKLAAERVRRFFEKGKGTREGYARVRPELRQMITFQPVNLLEPQWSVRAPLDVIFCRNVLIYFDKQTQAGIVRRFVPLLRPEGVLFVGHSESLSHFADAFRPVGRTIYAPAFRPSPHTRDRSVK